MAAVYHDGWSLMPRGGHWFAPMWAGPEREPDPEERVGCLLAFQWIVTAIGLAVVGAGVAILLLFR